MHTGDSMVRGLEQGLSHESASVQESEGKIWNFSDFLGNFRIVDFNGTFCLQARRTSLLFYKNRLCRAETL